MPGILYRPATRRVFLQHSSKAIAAAFLVSPFRAFAGAPARSDRALHLALISDTHVAADPKNEFRKFLPWENLKRVVSQVAETSPDAVIHDGDVARLEGKLEDYQAVEQLLSPLAEKYPLFLGLGNHDDRENFLKVFPPDAKVDQKVAAKHVQVFEHPVLRVIQLDSLLYVNKVAGLLGKAQREWLDRYLARCDMRPTVVFVHHTLGEGDGELLDAEALFRIVQPYQKVKAIIYGHSHEYAYAEHQGIHLVNLPAVGYNFADREPVGWVDAHFNPAGVDLTLKAFGGNRAKDGQTTSLLWRGA